MDEQNQIDGMLLDYIDESRNRLVEHVRQMVRIDDVEGGARDRAPFDPSVKKTLDLALSISRDVGFKTVDSNGYIGYAFYSGGEDYVCTMGYVDVVPVGEGREEPPFEGHMKNGVIYSRGVLGNREPAIACLYGLAVVRVLGLPLRRPIRITFRYDGGTGFEDLRYYLSKEKPPICGFTSDYKYPAVCNKWGGAAVHITGIRECLGIFFDFVNKYLIGAGNTDGRLGVGYHHEEHGVMETHDYRPGSDLVWKAGQGNIRRVNARDKNTEVSVGNRSVTSAAHFEATLSYLSGVTIQEIMEPVTEEAESCGLEAGPV